MSFDVYIRGDGEDGGELWWRNITHNVNAIVDRCFIAAGAPRAKEEGSSYEERSWGRLAGWKASDAHPFVVRALAESLSLDRREEFLALEPDNGWGSLESAQNFFLELARGTSAYPDGIITAHG